MNSNGDIAILQVAIPEETSWNGFSIDTNVCGQCQLTKSFVVEVVGSSAVNCSSEQDNEKEKEINKWDDCVFYDFIPNAFKALGVKCFETVSSDFMLPVIEAVEKAYSYLRSLLNGEYLDLVCDEDDSKDHPKRTLTLNIQFILKEGSSYLDLVKNGIINTSILDGFSAWCRKAFLADISENGPEYCVIK